MNSSDTYQKPDWQWNGIYWTHHCTVAIEARRVTILSQKAARRGCAYCGRKLLPSQHD